jgi:hypothetical protein
MDSGSITSQGGPLGRQPAPVLELPPAQFSTEVLRSWLEVPCHRDRPWKGETPEPVRSWQDAGEAEQLDARTGPAWCQGSTSERRRYERS